MAVGKHRLLSPAAHAAFLLTFGGCWLAHLGVGLPEAGAAPPAVKAPNDPLFRFQWHLRDIQIPQAWAVSRGAGAVVAVLDTGVAYEDRGRFRRAPDLAGTRFVPGWDFVDGDSHPNDEAPTNRRSHGTHIANRRSHGTHIAGIIAQTTDNRVGGAGIAPRAAIMPIRVLQPDLDGTARDIARGLRYAARHGADVANLSIAGPVGVPVLKRAISYATSRGVTVVASAGNDGHPRLSFPAAYPKVMAVGASNREGARAYYSNYGRGLDLVAPAGDGDEGTEGGGVLQQTLKGGPASFCYCFMSSTSAAAAEVSAAAALLVASGRASGPAEVRAALEAGAKDLGPRGRDTEFGDGLLQVSSALTAADPAKSTATPAGSRSSGIPLVGWLALTIAGAALAALLRLSLLRRRRRTH